MHNEIHNSRKPSSFSGSHPQGRAPRNSHATTGRYRNEKLPLVRVVTAGGIIFRRIESHIEFFFLRDGHGKWTFPKGKQGLGETLAETAIREIREETGLTGLTYMAPLGHTSFRFRSEGSLIEKTVFYFLFEAPASAKVTLTSSEGITEADWFRADKVFSVSGYRNLDRLLAKALRLVAEQEERRAEVK